MPSPTGKNDAARSLFAQGLTMAGIAERLGISRATVQKYKADDRGTDRDWKKLRAELKGKTPPVPSKLISFDRSREKSQAAAVVEMLPPGVDRSEIVSNLIVAAEAMIRSGEIPSALGGALNGIATLIKLERDLKPATAADLADEAIKLGIRPAEFMTQLREAWERAS